VHAQGVALVVGEFLGVLEEFMKGRGTGPGPKPPSSKNNTRAAAPF